jgi:hypothetical protein
MIVTIIGSVTLFILPSYNSNHESSRMPVIVTIMNKVSIVIISVLYTIL